jgi:3-oxoacyl-[acyl-carrier-protein] synthase-3
MTLCSFDDLPPVGIAGLGHALPDTLRDDDAEFLQRAGGANPFAPLFTGYGTRRVLRPDESLAELMAKACLEALRSGARDPAVVDLLTGYASVGEFVAPNELFHVHQKLELPASAEVLPVADEFTAFLSGLRIAAERIWSRSSEVALVAAGSRWSSNIDHRDPVSVSIGDGAGAALVRPLGPGAEGVLRLRLVGWNSEVPPGMYGVMRMSPRKGDDPTTLTDVGATTRPVFNMLRESEAVFRQWGVEAPPRIARELLSRLHVDPRDVTCVAHQASSFLLDAWQRALEPVRIEHTISTLGNMTLASIPVTLCLCAPTLRTRYVLLLGLGLGIHASALLLECSP